MPCHRTEQLRMVNVPLREGRIVLIRPAVNKNKSLVVTGDDFSGVVGPQSHNNTAIAMVICPCTSFVFYYEKILVIFTDP